MADERVAPGWLLLPRLAAGGLLLAAGIVKIRSGFDANALSDALAGWTSSGAMVSFYQQSILPLVQERLDLVATLVKTGEVAAGASLVAGFGTRLGAVAGIVLAGNYLGASGEAINVLMLATHAALLAGGGRALGLDGAIRARVPAWVIG